MTNQPSIKDWAEYLIWAEENMKRIEDMLLHKDYDLDQLNARVAAVNHSLAQTLEWVANAKQAKR